MLGQQTPEQQMPGQQMCYFVPEQQTPGEWHWQ